MKRISFNTNDAREIYEWRLGLNQGSGKSSCGSCLEIEKRLRTFLGKSQADSLRKMVKKNPYFLTKEEAGNK